MSRPVSMLLAFLAMAPFWALNLSRAQAQAPAPRIALVIGNANYQAGALATPANDAGLVAATLQQAGFDVVGARDLDQDSLRRAFRDFLAKAQAAGPRAIAFVYLSGYGLQYEGENYLVPVEARIARGSDVPIEAVRISDLTRALAGIPLRARVVVLDAARANPFARQDALAGGLAIVTPDPGELIAFNAAPSTIGPTEQGSYGAYAQALAEMLAQPGVPVTDAFAQIRLRVNELTQGLEVPWDASALTASFDFVAPTPGAPAPVFLSNRARALRQHPLGELQPAEAYSVVIETDTIASYEDFLRAFPRDPLARRVRALLAARREAITWEQTVRANRPNAFWTYMRRYPRGPHVADARRRLLALREPEAPPASFAVYDYQDLPPPPPDEVTIVDERPVIVFEENDYPPPPPPPIWFIERPRREFVDMAPLPASQPGFLPVPVIVPFARDQRVGAPQRDQRVEPKPIALPAGVKPAPVTNAPRFTGGPVRAAQTPGAANPQAGGAAHPQPSQLGQPAQPSRLGPAPARPNATLAPPHAPAGVENPQLHALPVAPALPPRPGVAPQTSLPVNPRAPPPPGPARHAPERTEPPRTGLPASHPPGGEIHRPVTPTRQQPRLPEERRLQPLRPEPQRAAPPRPEPQRMAPPRPEPQRPAAPNHAACGRPGEPPC